MLMQPPPAIFGLNVNYKGGGWLKGKAPLGYGNGATGQKTKVSFGGNKSNRFVTTYFRRGFIVSDPNQVTSLTLQILHDDGAVVYLNGTIVAHPNMGASQPSYGTLASACSSGVVETVNIPVSLLVAGKNMLAVEVHQCAKNSANMIFNASLYAQGNNQPSAPTRTPTKAPTKTPTKAPTKVPTKTPTKVPTKAPTKTPTKVPTKAPTSSPNTGGLPPAPSGQKWALRWGDEFNGTSVDTSKWKINNLTRAEDPNKTWYIPQNVSEFERHPQAAGQARVIQQCQLHRWYA